MQRGAFHAARNVPAQKIRERAVCFAEQVFVVGIVPVRTVTVYPGVAWTRIICGGLSPSCAGWPSEPAAKAAAFGAIPTFVRELM
jgi:hypothetical protein